GGGGAGRGCSGARRNRLGKLQVTGLPLASGRVDVAWSRERGARMPVEQTPPSHKDAIRVPIQPNKRAIKIRAHLLRARALAASRSRVLPTGWAKSAQAPRMSK